MPISRKDFTGLTDWYMDTAGYNLDPSFTNLFLRDPKELDQRRFSAYRYFMDFYKGKHWEEKGEYNPAYMNGPLWSAEEYNRRTWNLTQNIVDKLVSFLVKEPWSIKLPEELEDVGTDDDQESDPFSQSAQTMGQPDSQGALHSNNDFKYKTEPKQSPIVQQVLDAVWEANEREQFSYDMAYMGCITGDCFVRISYDEDFYAEDVGELRIEVLDSRTVLPFFDGEDRKKLIGARIMYPTYEMQEDGSKRKVMYKEVHTASSIVTLIDDEIQNIAPNPLGELLIIHIKNEPLPYERYGRSDIEPLIVPNKEYNEKLSDLSEILAYHAAPVTIIKGARVQNLEKGARKVWGGIPKDGDVSNLNLEADLSSSIEYLTMLKKHQHETGNVPEEALGALQNVSNTSGAALHVQYQPLMERTQKKQICFGKGLVQINRLILRFYEAVGVLDLPEDVPPAKKYKTMIQWGDALPRDRSIDLADISVEIGLGILSKKEALRRLGEENPDRILEEVKEEMAEQAEMDFMAAGLGQFGDEQAGPMGLGFEEQGVGAKTGANEGPKPGVSGAVKAAKTNPVTQGSQTSSQAVKKSAQTKTGKNAKK